MSRGWAFDFLILSCGRVFVLGDCPRGRVFAPFESCPGRMVLDEIDSCIMLCKKIPVFDDWIVGLLQA